jgi:two-component system nitrate/nitrite sensor histidine kinase NarX
VELGAEEENQVLRIVQEALTNARKHSRANMVRVLLSEDNAGRFRVIIEDDGIGFTPGAEDRDTDRHFGLAIMRERAEAVGAALGVESEPGEGTRVVVELSLKDTVADGLETKAGVL